MRALSFPVPAAADGQTVGKFLRYACGVSARLITKQKRVEQGITLNGSHIRTVDRIRTGDVVGLNIPDDARPAQPSSKTAEVVYEDADVVVLEKPVDMPVHPTHGHFDDTLANALAAHLAERGEACVFRPINRLDKDTTGLVVVCRHSHGASRLHGHMHKLYYAVCEGELSGSGVIDAPIRRRENAGIRREVGEGGQRSVTRWRALGSSEELTLLEIDLETGRTHQIRTHFADVMNMPLAGDPMYGGHVGRIDRQALHCGQVDFYHPVTGEHVFIRSPLPEDMRALAPCALPEARYALMASIILTPRAENDNTEE